MDCGIVGLPGSGKTALFEALMGKRGPETQPGRPNVGVASIPDPRLAQIAQHIPTRKLTSATIRLVDIPGLEVGAGAQKTAALLAHIREVEAICHVVRCFGPDVSPKRDIAAIEDELVLADMAVAEPAMERARRPAQAGDADARARLETLERIMPVLEEGRPLRTITDLAPAHQRVVRSFGMVSAKPVLFVANVDEDDLAGAGQAAKAVRAHAETVGSGAVAVCASLEAELAELEGDDRQEMLEGLGLAEPAIGRVARAALAILGMSIFYTVGPKEVRAWPIAANATAPEAAGIVHSDMQRGFIRAECYSVNDLLELGDEKKIKAAGKFRVEGKGYRVRDGDVMHFLFSV